MTSWHDLIATDQQKTASQLVTAVETSAFMTADLSPSPQTIQVDHDNIGRWFRRPHSRAGRSSRTHISRVLEIFQNSQICSIFYRATRMHSADYAVARCLSVCLSVRHTPVLCLNGYTYPQNVFTVGYPHHSSFSLPNGMAIFRREPPPLKGASNARGYEKNQDFWPISGFISELMQDRAIVTMEGE